MKNKDLAKFYERIYKGGEKKHYTKFLLGKRKLPEDIHEVLAEVNWPGKSVLEVGCGTGLLSYMIAKRGAKKVVGIDFAKSAIQLARKKYRHPHLKYYCEDIKNYRGIYNVIVFMGTLEHMDDPFTVIKRSKKYLKSKGSLIITCPNWTNPRGYILQTLWHLFGAPITLTDLHYLTPIEFQKWAKQLDMRLKWRTFDYDWAHGERLVSDFRRRLPKVLKDAKLSSNKKNVNDFSRWIKEHIIPLNHKTKFSGATGLYHYRLD